MSNGVRLRDKIAEAMNDPHYCVCGHFETDHNNEGGQCRWPGCDCMKFVAEEDRRCPMCGKLL